MLSPSSSTLALGDVIVVLARQHIGERGFARTVRAHDGRDLALFDSQRQAVEDFLVLDLDVKVLDFQEWHLFVLLVFAVEIVGLLQVSHPKETRGFEIAVFDSGRDTDLVRIRIIDHFGRRGTGNAEIT